jgi:cell division protein FtsN
MKFERGAERGGFAIGMVAGLLIGLALALAVALFITKAPVPFVNKVPARTAEQDSAEIERNRNWDPNASLGGKVGARPGAAASPPPSTTGFPDNAGTAGVPGQPPLMVPVPATVTGQASAPANKNSAPSTRDPAAILAGGGVPSTVPGVQAGAAGATAVDPFIYFVQAGAYARNEEAEQQRAKLALLGQQAKITEREQSGRTMYRVRVGPFPRRDDADNLQARLQEQSIESQIVRVEKP